MRYVFIILFFLSAFVSLSAQRDTLSLHPVADHEPYFAGCEQAGNEITKKRACSDERLSGFITQYLVYPEKAVEKGLEGTVIVSFVVDEKGAVTNETVVRDIGEGCGQAALNILKAMPRWEPAVHSGQKVKVKLTLPIRFYFKSQTHDESKSYSIHWGKLRGEKASKSVLKDCVNDQLYVRDASGNAVRISDLTFTFEKKRKSTEAKVTGSTLDKKMKKLIQKSSEGGTLTISATVQKEGKMIVVEKSFLVEE